MRPASTALTTLLLLCTFQAGWILSGVFQGGVAHAEPTVAIETGAAATTTAAPSAAGSGAPRSVLCRRFTLDLNTQPQIDTGDRTTEIGDWVARQSGYELDDVDFDIAQKPTGYPQGWVHVCLRPVVAAL
jgi:hypothetical protein